MMRLPDFLIIGAPRSGTTWLYKVLERHPDIWLAKPMTPEPKFFLVDSEYQKGLHYYSNLFAEAPPDATVGEKSTNYLESGRAADRIATALPDVKMIVLLREPAERALSNWRWSRSNGLEHESFDDALALESAREASYPTNLRYSRPFSYASRGRYAQLLPAWLDTFGRHRMLVEDFESVRRNPKGLIEIVHAFLDVDVRVQDAAVEGVVNAAPKRDEASAETLRGLRRSFAADNDRLVALLGDDAPDWARQRDRCGK